MCVPRAVTLKVSARAAGHRSTRSVRSHVLFLTHYVAILVAAELLLVFANLTGNGTLALLGMLFDVFLVVSLPVEAYLFVAKDRPLATFLGALMLPPLVRVVSLSIPTAYFTTVEWLAIVGVPLLLAAAAVMNAAGLRRADVFLGLGERRYIAINILIIFIGFGLGFVEYRILRPEPWIPASDRGQLPFAVVAIFLTNGLAEELIFRGILLRTGVALMGRQGALLYVTLVFTVLHVGFMSVPDLVFVFVVGLVFGIAVLFTRSLWGVVGAHTLANVALYLILPFGF